MTARCVGTEETEPQQLHPTVDNSFTSAGTYLTSWGPIYLYLWLSVTPMVSQVPVNYFRTDINLMNLC